MLTSGLHTGGQAVLCSVARMNSDADMTVDPRWLMQALTACKGCRVVHTCMLRVGGVWQPPWQRDGIEGVVQRVAGAMWAVRWCPGCDRMPSIGCC